MNFACCCLFAILWLLGNCMPKVNDTIDSNLFPEPNSTKSVILKPCLPSLQLCLLRMVDLTNVTNKHYITATRSAIYTDHLVLHKRNTTLKPKIFLTIEWIGLFCVACVDTDAYESQKLYMFLSHQWRWPHLRRF